ncbi:MAG TPA: 23S rRNA (adenine(2503)-C(2))-methyltransferase RlmN [Candidatus Methanoperedens sp.]|nr:23S rRNA (adenine(2503)-C(2))-methyltransferase RlmN [Candidatus Methanoperedens sp.]
MERAGRGCDLRGLPRAPLETFCAGLGLSAAQARRIFSWLHRPGQRDLAAPGGLGREIRFRLAGRAHVSRFEPAAVARSRDGTVKYAFRLDDGAAIESVLLRAGGRTTLCVSTQAGCAMGCRFCLTGRRGLRRDLTAAEIVNQVAAVRDCLLAEAADDLAGRQSIGNLVFMGMGEPLANYGNLLDALAILGDGQGPGFSERRLTVSTCGLGPRIRDLGRDARVSLAVSLHTADDSVRGELMPVNRACGVDELLAACREYAAGGRRVVFFECVLLAGVNDSDRDARLLAERLRGIPCRINLLEYNESPLLPYRRSPAGRVAAFRDILHAAGCRTLLRRSRGADIAAACGQLAGEFASTVPACY